MAERQQFDHVLGGREVLPVTVNVMSFVSARAEEIAALTEAIEDPQRIIGIPQRLPKHMQRRIMSHNVKRIPVKLRESHIEMGEKGGPPVETKRPRRKYRRRPQNLLAEYNRRQRKFVWLETHLWHAKRFHMVEKWGYKLADFPNDKSFRACFRASKAHCLLQDVSYYACIEVKGTFDHIIIGLNQLTSTQCGLTFGAKCTLEGLREHSLPVFRIKEYPNGMIGTVNFLWKPPDKCDPCRTLWIWVHPAYYLEFLEQIISVFNLKMTGSEPANVTDKEEVKIDPKLEIRNVPFCRVPVYKSSNDEVTVALLKDTLNRFRLVGPLSQPILTDALRIINPEKLSIQQNKSQNDSMSESDWAQNIYNTAEGIECLKKKKEFWERMKTVTNPAQLPPHCVIPLVVSDPRYHMPLIRTKQVSDSSGPDCQLVLKTAPVEFVKDNPLWDPTIRDDATKNRLSTSQLNDIKSKQLVPGVCDLEHIAPSSHLPVILIQNPGCRTIGKKGGSVGFGSGWDVIVPAGWAMPLWLCLVWRGARVGGLRESAALCRESGLPPLLPPDSKAGQTEQESNKQAKLAEFFRKPPAKRPNFLKLGFTAPFHCAWRELLRDWNNSDSLPSAFCVLRDRNLLEKLNAKLAQLKTYNRTCIGESVVDNVPLERSSFLVAVNLRVCRRGVLDKYSHVCIPKSEDLKIFETDKHFMGPTELSHLDPYQTERKATRKRHIKIMARLKKKRKVVKEKNDVETLNILRKQRDKKVADEEAHRKELWLPEDVKNVKNSSSREIIGFVTSGDFSFREACSTGQAYISLTAFLKFCSNWKNISSTVNPLILTRAPTNYQYSFAEMSIIL